MSAMLDLAAALYVCNCAVGLAARRGLARFGVWHHWLYAAVFASAIAALLLEFQAGLLLTVAALALFPRAHPRSPWHPALAVVGLLGHGVALISRP